MSPLYQYALKQSNLLSNQKTIPREWSSGYSFVPRAGIEPYRISAGCRYFLR